MTDTPHQCSVVEADRQAVFAYWNHPAEHRIVPITAVRDDHILVQAFARHREAALTDLTAAAQLHRSGLITPEKYNHIREMIRARSVIQGEAAA